MKPALFICVLSFCFALGGGQALCAGSSDGEAVYKRSCLSCHGDKGTTPRGKATQGIKVYSSAEAMRIFSGYADGSYGGGGKDTMRHVLSGLSAEERQAVADYIGSLK